MVAIYQAPKAFEHEILFIDHDELLRSKSIIFQDDGRTFSRLLFLVGAFFDFAESSFSTFRAQFLLSADQTFIKTLSKIKQNTCTPTPHFK